MVTASLQDIQETDEVACQVGIGVSDAIPYAGLCCKVDDLVEMLTFKEDVQSLFVFYAHAHETQGGVAAAWVVSLPFCFALYVNAQQGPESSVLQSLVVVVVDVVKCYDFVAAFGEQHGNL